MIFIKNQFNIIYNDIDLKFRQDIKRLNKNVIINTFLINLNEYKHE